MRKNWSSQSTSTTLGWSCPSFRTTNRELQRSRTIAAIFFIIGWCLYRPWVLHFLLHRDAAPLSKHIDVLMPSTRKGSASSLRPAEQPLWAKSISQFPSCMGAFHDYSVHQNHSFTVSWVHLTTRFIIVKCTSQDIRGAVPTFFTYSLIRNQELLCEFSPTLCTHTYTHSLHWFVIVFT